MYKFIFSVSARSYSFLCIGLYILICHLTLSSLWILAVQSELFLRLSLTSLIEHSLASFTLLLIGAMLLDISQKETKNKK